jgi:hypothetical protein
VYHKILRPLEVNLAQDILKEEYRPKEKSEFDDDELFYIFILLISWGCVRLSPLCTSVTNWHISSAPG